MNLNDQLKEIEWENQQIELGVARYRDSVDGNPMSQTTPGQKLMEVLLPDLIEGYRALRSEAADVINEGSTKGQWTYVIDMLPPDVIAVLVLQTVFDAMVYRVDSAETHRGVLLQRIAAQIGKAFESQVEYDRFTQAASDEENPEARTIDLLIKRAGGTVNRSTLYRWKRRFESYESIDWDDATLVNVGSKLVAQAIETHGDIFAVEVVRTKNRRNNILTLTQEVWSDLETLHACMEIGRPFYLPTIIPPQPWHRDESGRLVGGYWLHKPNLFSTSVHKHTSADPGATSDDFLTAVNRVQTTAWQINQRVYQWLQLCVEMESEHLPEEPGADGAIRLSDEEWGSLDDDDRKEIIKERREWHESQASIRGAYTAFHRKLQIAELLEGRVFYMPHFADFRGRLYPMPQELNPQGDHWAKGLLEFAEGQKLGHDGLYWLKVHVANMAGKDKSTYDERIAFVDENYSKLTTRDFIDEHVAGDELCTYMAAAWDLTDALSLDDPTQHISHIPVAMDGVCNGMQILSLLGRDEVGAKATNCSADPVRQDLYSEVAQVVQQRLIGDSALGLLEASNWLDHFRDNGRKVVKRAVMTTPYGVTDIGISDQLISDKHTRDLGGDPKANADYMRDCIRDAMSQVAGKAKELMAYFQDCAKVLAKEGLPLSWVTPANLRVTQSYWTLRRTSVVTVLGRVRRPVEDRKLGLDVRKNALSAAPNVVHSLDAALLQRVVLRLGIMGITDTAMIHDSYGVHAANVKVLHTIIRSEAAIMFEHPWLDEFHDRLVDLCVENAVDPALLPAQPEPGDFLVTDVLNAPYFFS